MCVLGGGINHRYWMGHMLAKDCPIPFNRYKVRAAGLAVHLSGANAGCGSQSGEITGDQPVSLVQAGIQPGQ